MSLPAPLRLPADDTLFRVEALTRTYGSGPGAVHALRGVDLEIARGRMIVLLGPSGSGKSTFLNIIGGLDRATSGHVHFDGLELTAASDRALTDYRRRHLGFVFQFYNLIASLTALENVALIAGIAADPMAPMEALARVGLADRANHFPGQLSGGEQQRVAIARAIAKRPSVLLCDEPTGALDSETGIKVLAALDSINREVGATTILITHNVVIAGMADEVLRFADGRLAAREPNPNRQRPEAMRW